MVWLRREREDRGGEAARLGECAPRDASLWLSARVFIGFMPTALRVTRHSRASREPQAQTAPGTSWHLASCVLGLRKGRFFPCACLGLRRPWLARSLPRLRALYTDALRSPTRAAELFADEMALAIADLPSVPPTPTSGRRPGPPARAPRVTAAELSGAQEATRRPRGGGADAAFVARVEAADAQASAADGTPRLPALPHAPPPPPVSNPASVPETPPSSPRDGAVRRAATGAGTLVSAAPAPDPAGRSAMGRAIRNQQMANRLSTPRSQTSEATSTTIRAAEGLTPMEEQFRAALETKARRPAARTLYLYRTTPSHL